MSDWSSKLTGRKDDPQKTLADQQKALLAQFDAETAEPDSYRPALIKPHAQMMFSVVEADGTRHGFQYHNLRHPQLRTIGGDDYLTFTADGVAVAMQGTGLRDIYIHLTRYALAELRAYREGEPRDDKLPLISHLEVVDTKKQPEEPHGLRLVK